MIRPIYLFAALPLHLCMAVEFDSAFSPRMVLQRDAPVRLSGTGGAGHDISVAFDAEAKSARVAGDGRWSVEFPPVKAGGPHVIKATEGAESVVLDDVLSGDVWLCSGQSNMQMNLHETTGGKEAMAKAAASHEIRILTMPRGGNKEPQKKFGGQWQTASAETVKDFSAVAWFFAMHLKDDPELAEVPLGIVNSSFGGTAIEAWVPADSLPDMPENQVSGSMFGIPAGTLFNGMIAPLTDLNVKGAVWYQGEANAGHPQVYAKLLVNLMNQWRSAFHQPELPFFIVELPSFEGKMGGYDFSWLREAQAAACDETENAWLAVTYDTTDGHNLHPVDKEEIGRRLALRARREIYRSKIVAGGPAFKEAKVEGTQLRITFGDSDGLGTRDGKPPAGFAIAGPDGEYRYATAALDGSAVILKNLAIPSPATVRYSWGGMPSGNLVNRDHLPVAPFRTDTLAPGKVSLQPLPAAYRIETPNYQLSTSDNGQIASLIVHGKQFLSNELNGGTRIPDAFGPRDFRTVEELGPRRLRTSDNSGSLEIAGSDDSMEWTIHNDRGNPIEFYIALSSLAKVETSDHAAVISRDDRKLKIEVEGQVKVDNSEMVVTIPPRSTVTLGIQLMP